MNSTPALNEAMKHHKKGEEDKALEKYIESLNKEGKSNHAFQNAFAILRKQKSYKQAQILISAYLKSGLSSASVYGNIGNLILDEGSRRSDYLL